MRNNEPALLSNIKLPLRIGNGTFFTLAAVPFISQRNWRVCHTVPAPAARQKSLLNTWWFLDLTIFDESKGKKKKKKNLFPHFLNGYVQFVRNWGPDSSHFTAATSSISACCLQSSLESWISTLLPQTTSAKVWHLPRWAADTLCTLSSPHSCPNPHLENSRAISDTGDGSHYSNVAA